MQLESVRELKDGLHETLIVPLAASPLMRRAGLRAQPMTRLASTPPTIALGVSRVGRADYRLAVRVQKRGLESSAYLETIRKRAKGEVDVRYIGQVTKRARVAASPPWQQKRVQPLRIGASVGHYRITAGTLGCFVTSRTDDTQRILMLSNNHVLANENRSRRGSNILQPGQFDGGRNSEDKVADLLRFVRLKKDGVNRLDAAVAALDSDIEFRPKMLTGLGTLAGLGDPLPDEPVAKIGRTTGLTRGRITAFELDNVVVQYDIGVLKFDDQIEIESLGDGPFSQGGDSGALIVDEGLRGVALLFAGSDLGGSNDLGLTYANPLGAVLDGLKVTLFLG